MASVFSSQLCLTCDVPAVLPKEPYSKPPQIRPPDDPIEWDGTLEVEGGVAELRDVRVSNELALGECLELHLIDCQIDNVSFADSPGVELHIERSMLATCDLSQAKVSTLISSVVAGGKFVGTDLSGSDIIDVEFRGSTFRYLSFSMAELTRVAFVDCDLNELDLYDSALTDISFEGTCLVEVSIDRCKLKQVDFRGAEQLGLTSTNSMRGSIILEGQVLALAFQFAIASGVDIESPQAEASSR